MPPLPFGHKLDFVLIKLVKQNSHLYDGKQSQYTDSEARDETWAKIGAELNRTAADCKSRWVNIRDQMRRKYRDRLKGKKGAQQKYKYESVLGFIIPLFRDLPNSGENAISINDSVYFSDGEETNFCMVDEVEPDSGDDPMDNKALVQKDHLKMDTVESCRWSAGAGPSSSPQPPSYLQTTDSIDVFLLSIGSTLRKFSPYYLNQAKSKIFQIISEYELEQILENKKEANNPLDMNTPR